MLTNSGYSLDFLTEDDTKFDSMIMKNNRDFASSLLGGSDLLAAQKPVEDMKEGFGDATSPFKSKALKGKPRRTSQSVQAPEVDGKWMYDLDDPANHAKSYGIARAQEAATRSASIQPAGGLSPLASGVSGLFR